MIFASLFLFFAFSLCTYVTLCCNVPTYLSNVYVPGRAWYLTSGAWSPSPSKVETFTRVTAEDVTLDLP